MATRATRQNLPPVQRRFQRLADNLLSLIASGDLIILALVFLVLLMPVLSLQAAEWPLNLRTLLPVVTLSVIFGYLLARSHYNELLALVMSAIYGGAFVLFFAALNEGGGLLQGTYSVFRRGFDWLLAAFTGGINQDELVFTMLIALLLWFLGYSAAWHVFRIDRVWRAILPPGLILITNSIYYAGERNLDLYLIIFMFSALLLVVHSNLDAREWDWYVNGIRVPKHLRQQFYRMGAIFALLALLVAWVIPASDLQDRLDRFHEFLAQDPLTELGEFWNRLFAAGDIQGPATTDYYGSDSLQLGGAIQLGEQEVMLVAAPAGRRYYWRSRVFDTYENGRWLPAADTRLSDPQAPLEIAYEDYVPESRVVVQQTFTMTLPASRLVYAAPQPLNVDLPTRTDLRYIGLDDHFINPDDSADQNVKAMNISAIRPAKVLRRGDIYTVTSLMSNATASQLRAAGLNYPAWVTDLYLYVSSSVTQRTKDLARQIVTQAGAVTPYDQAKAIESWLRQNIIYQEMIPEPPEGQDPVDWLLFDYKQGYCNYYASAMIVMLRSLGIPARMAAGFAQGTYDASLQQFVVEERDAHTWVEVYFPGHGWIEFEPTAAQAPLNRSDEAPVFQLPSPTLQPSPSATNTPTVTPTTPPPPTLPPINNEGRSLPTPTPTFTPSPTATATPIILPTVPPPVERIQNQNNSLLSFILPLLKVVAVILALIILLVVIALITWWWWEWRGMRGLSPITRAYARMERYIRLIGIHLSSDQTPIERRQRIVRTLPQAEHPVTAITNLYTAERYGPGQRHPMDFAEESDAADAAWTDTRSSILRRWLARLVKPWQRDRGQ